MRTDEVTALLLYEDFIEQVEYELKKHAGKKLVMITMDFSNFNYINNMYGYKEGDKLLRQAADEFLRGSRGFLCGCRMYSDHFAALFEHDNHNDWLQMLTVNRGDYLRDTRTKFAATFLQLYIGIYFGNRECLLRRPLIKRILQGRWSRAIIESRFVYICLNMRTSTLKMLR